MTDKPQPGQRRERRLLLSAIATNADIARIAGQLLDLDPLPRSRQLIAALLLVLTDQALGLNGLLLNAIGLVAPVLAQNGLIRSIVGRLLDDRPNVKAAGLLAVAALSLHDQALVLGEVAKIRGQSV